MHNEFYSHQLLSVIDRIDRANTTEAALACFEGALADIGADYVGVLFLPRPDERIEDVCLAWKCPPEWREVYAGQNLCQRDPVIRHLRRSVLPFEWASAPYDPETERHMGVVLDRAHDLNVHKGVSVPIPSPTGIIGAVWAAGPHFVQHEIHKVVLQSLALHVFHRLEKLVGRRPREGPCLTEREREVLAWASEGKTAWEIGCILSLSQRTIEWHFRQAYRKLGATNRMQAIAIFGDAHEAYAARRNGVVD